MDKVINLNRRRFLNTAAVTMAAARLGATSFGKTWSDLSPLARATTWLNSPTLTRTELEGKTVLVEFWTYSCINWRRQLPYVRAWAEKYKNQGLVVIGVHSPEFPFERDLQNIRWAASNMRVVYPIAVDSDHAVWNGFRNEYWPALYLADRKGRIRYRRFGEGDYEESEQAIQRLLTESGAVGVGHDVAAVDARGAEAAADWKDLRSPENYVGYERTENFVSSNGSTRNKPHNYSPPGHLTLNHWSLSGNWTIRDQDIVLNQSDGHIVYRFHARDLHLVMGATNPAIPARFRVLIDGDPPGESHGVDANEHGNGTVTTPRMYQLVRQSRPIVDRQFEIEFPDPGVNVFSFTFG